MLKRGKLWLDKQRKINRRLYKLLVKLLKSYSCLYCSQRCDLLCNGIANDLGGGGQENCRINELLNQIKKREAECDSAERDDALDNAPI